MNTTERRWSVAIVIDEHDDGHTYAEARLTTNDPQAVQLIGSGLARRSPRDHEVPEIGDELAAARALADLSARLLEVTSGDIEAVAHSSGAGPR